jgi:positive regulator of sigma E activity
MHWYDWMTLVIVVGGTIIQTVRGSKAGGMGLPLFEAGGVIVAAVGSTAFTHGLAVRIHVSESVVLLVLFLVFSVVGFIVARWLFTLTGMSFQSLDGLFSFLFGFVLAWTVAHMVLRIVIMSQGGNGEVAAQMVNSPVAREVYQFRTWNALVRLLFKAKLAPDFNPDEG